MINRAVSAMQRAGHFKRWGGSLLHLELSLVRICFIKQEAIVVWEVLGKAVKFYDAIGS